MICIFDHYSGGIIGTNTSMIDLLFFLKQKIQVQYCCSLNINNFKDLLSDVNKNFTNESFGSVVHKFVKKELKEYDTVITNFYTLTQSGINIQCKKLIVFDSTGVINFKEFPLENVSADEIILLGNPSNDIFPEIKFIEYYHKFSKERLEYIRPKFKTINKSLTTAENKDPNLFCHVAQFKKYFSQYNTNINNCDLSHLKENLSAGFPHDCQDFRYQRWYEIKPGLFIENIGKLIFEFQYFNKPVWYSAKNKTVNDGLHWYLKLFNIDDTKDQELKIQTQEIKEKLLFNKKDIILDLI